MPEPEALVADYQARLDAAASARSRAWWERYLRGVIPFRGVGLPENLRLLKAWRAERGLDGWPVARELEAELAHFSREALTNALKYQPRALRNEYFGRQRRA